LLLVLDDLHWVDQGSASLLFHIGRQIRNNRILVIGSFRTSEVTLGRDEKRHPIEPIFHELKRDFGDIELDLEKLKGREFVDAFLDTEPNELDEKFREILFTQTKGQPLFTVELWRTMKEQGMLVQNQEGRWIKGRTFNWNSLPSRVDAVIRERIGRLTTYMQEILTYASVEGEEFTAELVALLQKQEIREVIQILSSELEKRHHLVAVKGIRRMENQRLSLYVFQNILFQKYLYNTLDEVQRTYLHEEVGNLLESLYGDRVDEISVQLARHFQKAGILPKALKYLAESGNKALHLSAYAETIVHFKKALDILRTIPPTPECEQQELSFQIALVASLQATQGFASPDVISTCRRIQEICQRIAGSPQVFHALYLLANFHWLRAEHIAGFELTKQMMTLAQKSEDSLMLALTHFVKGALSFNMGKLCSAKEHLEKMNAFYNPTEHSHLAFIYGQDPGQISGSNTSCVLWCLGYPDQALQQSQKALAIAREVDHPFSLTGALAMDTLFNLLRRDIKALEERGKEVTELAEKKGFLFFVGVGVFKIGVALAHKGQIEEGIARLHQALNIYRTTGVRFTLTDLLASIAEVYGMAGQIEKALEYISQALVEVERGGERYYEAEIHRIKGELLLRKAERKDRAVWEKNADICFRKSIDIAQHQKARCLELRTALRLSRLWQKQGYTKKARKLLTEIYKWFTEGFETPELKEAKTLLEELVL
jgi:predicted ATPase